MRRRKRDAVGAMSDDAGAGDSAVAKVHLVAQIHGLGVIFDPIRTFRDHTV